MTTSTFTSVQRFTYEEKEKKAYMCVTEQMMAAFAKYGGEDNCINGTCICFSNLCNQGSALLLLHTLAVGAGAVLLLALGYGGGGGN